MTKFSRQQAIDATAEATAGRETIQARLLELDGCFGKQLLASTQLTGVTKQRWEGCEEKLAAVWETYTAYSAVVDKAAQLAAGHLGHRELAELNALLTAPTVEFARTTRGGLVDTARELVTLTAARTRMENDFTLAHDVIDAAERSWTDQAARLDAVTSALASLDPSGDDAITADIAGISAELARLRAALNADPLGASAVSADALREQCQRVARRTADLAALHTDAARQIAELRAVADAFLAAQSAAAAAHEQAAARIQAVPPLPAAADPVPQLAAVDGLVAAGRWDILRTEVDRLRQDLAAQTRLFHESELSMVHLLGSLDELHELLDACKAKVSGLGAAENASLTMHYDSAHALLCTAPCDLTAAEAAVTSYQQAVRASEAY